MLIILIDALRADHLGCYGYERRTSPVIDALAADGQLFATALSPASWTKPAIPSLFTGLYPIQHGVTTGNKRDTAERITSDVLRDEHVTLAEALQAAGYATGAFVHNAQISSFMGFGQGFDLYVEELGDAMSITERCLTWLHGEAGRPFFAYLHYLDPHWPYTPPTPFARLFPLPAKTTVDFNRANWKQLKRQLRAGDIILTAADAEAMRALYDGEIRYTDAMLGQLLATLRDLELDEETIIVLTADHGEEFFDHGGIGHGNSLYDELLRIPLVFRVPGATSRRLATPVELIDVMPTLLELTGCEVPAGVAGRSLAPALLGGDLEPRATFADHRPGGDHGRWLQSVRLGDEKLIRTYELPSTPERAGVESPAMPELRRDTWLEVEGYLGEDNRFVGLEVESMEPREEIGLVGVMRRYSPGQGTFHLLGIECRLTESSRVRDAAHRPLSRVVLDHGVWVKVKGTLAADGVLEASRVTLVDDPDRREPELKAPVSAVEEIDAATRRLEMVGLTVLLDKKTRYKGDWPSAPPLGVVASTPVARLRESRSLLTLELYDLSRDPGEQQNLATRRPQRVAELGRALDLWEETLTRDLPGGAAVALDPQAIKQLRALGYVQ